jgi:hypothetical protein
MVPGAAPNRIRTTRTSPADGLLTLIANEVAAVERFVAILAASTGDATSCYPV